MTATLVETPTADLATPAECLTISGIICAGETAPLTGWLQAAVISAAHALDWRPERIAAALDLTRKECIAAARDIGINLTQPDREPDWYAINMVCDGATMRLHPADRPEAVRRLAHRMTTGQIAKRIGCETTVVTRIAEQYDIETQPAQTRLYPPARRPVAA